LTAGINIPEEVIRQFNQSIYSRVIADTSSVFFAYKQDNASLFARDVSYIGIAINSGGIVKGTSGKQIAPGTYITSRYLP
jgi:hypothetical protein